MENRISKGHVGWLRATSLALAFAALAAPAARAGVEYVTRVGQCTNHVDEIGDGKDLFIVAGPSVQFEVFGNSVDLSNPTTGLRVGTDSGTGNVTARIVSQTNGPTNGSKGCGNTGSAVVQVDSPINLTSNIQRSLYFKMPAGDESRLQMTIKALPAFTVTWTTVQNSVSCIVKTGSFERLDQDHKIKIQLPPGSAQDQTTCNQNTLVAHITPASINEIDINRAVSYSASGLPNFLTASSPQTATTSVQTDMSFPINVARIRGLTAASNSNIVITSTNPSRTANLSVEVLPGITNGFTQPANCNNPLTGKLVTAGDLVQCELRLSLAPANGQLITFQAVDRLCFAAGAPGVTYFSSTGVGTTTLTGSGVIFQVPLRVQNASMSTGQPCASQTGVQQTVKFWVGPRDIESGADFTQDSIRIKSPN
ncbi:MAG: hypothetical protein M3167_10600 [Acidobacteriota bacterium]|nr:hypothetical protein [Acidobacteriota bacterium]